MENVKIDISHNQSKKKLFGFRTKLSYKNFFFSDNVLVIETKRTKIFISKPVVFDKSILEISKIVIDGF